MADEPAKATTNQSRRECSCRPTAIRDQDGKKIVFIAFKGKPQQREVHITAQRSGGLLVEWPGRGRECDDRRPADLKDGDKIKIKGQS